MKRKLALAVLVALMLNACASLSPVEQDFKKVAETELNRP